MQRRTLLLSTLGLTVAARHPAIPSVAGSALARQKPWVTVAEVDAKAFPGQNAIMEVIAAEGAARSRAVWDGRLTDFPSPVAAQGRSVNHTVPQKGMVVPADPEDTPAAKHINTWRIACGIPGPQAWIVAQRKAG